MTATHRPMGTLDLSMTADHACLSDDGSSTILKVGDVVEYRGHVVGGMVRVRFVDGHEDIVHPHCFAQLRSR